jgi:hypothetical protein
MAQDLHALGEKASDAVAARFSWDEVFPRLFEIYDAVVAEHRSR